MRKHVMMVMIASLLGVIVPVASAQTTGSNYTGPVLDIRSQPSPTTPGNVRVSIETSGSSVCTDAPWYSYDLPDGPVEKLWSAILLSALVSGRSVHIGGSGTCDAYNIETVSYIDAL